MWTPHPLGPDPVGRGDSTENFVYTLLDDPLVFPSDVESFYPVLFRSWCVGRLYVCLSTNRVIDVSPQ